MENGITIHHGWNYPLTITTENQKIYHPDCHYYQVDDQPHYLAVYHLLIWSDYNGDVIAR